MSTPPHSEDQGAGVPQDGRPSESDPTATDPAAPRRSRRGSRRRKKGVGRSIGQVLGIMTVALAMVVSLGAMYMYRKLNSNITHSEAQQYLKNRPKNLVEGAMDILVMGSDYRADGSKAGELSDTTILVHLSADRKRAYGISIPRDSVVQRPDCSLKGGKTVPGGEDLWNAAYSYGSSAQKDDGGATCTMQQFETLTGIQLEHHIVVNFQGFKSMVDAIGGVNMCIPEPMSSSKFPGWELEAGKDVLLQGDDALNYVRVRYGVGDGTDLSRTRRQQAFIAAMIKKVSSAGTLSNPAKVTSFLNAATKSLTSDMNVTDMANLGWQFRNTGLDDIQFLTIPNYMLSEAPWSGKVRWNADADEVWEALARDEPIPDRFLEAMTSAKKGGTSTKATKIDGKKKGKKGKKGKKKNDPSASSSPTDTATDEPAEDYYADPYADPSFNGLCG